MANILVLGATGYIGSRLIPGLLSAGHKVTVLVRDPQGLDNDIKGRLNIFIGDVMRPDSISEAFNNVEVVYYLIHSMSAGEDRFEEFDKTAAQNVLEASEKSGVRRIIYLGGLGKKKGQESKHLRSRHQVAKILMSGSIPVTEFRAAVIVGQGSFSFEMIHHLVNRLPIMICPRWVMTRTQPIAIDDVLRYLIECLSIKETVGKTIDIGGPDILSYRDMMLTTARQLGLRRYLINVPILTPKLSSYWLKFVTPISFQVAAALIEGLKSETIRENDLADNLFGFSPLSYNRAVQQALSSIINERIKTRTDLYPEPSSIESSHFKIDKRTIECDCTPINLFRVIKSIGGDNGWYYATWLWKLRGIIDRIAGGPGFRKTKLDRRNIRIGDIIDFWRVVKIDNLKRLLLHAEMKVWGIAWLEFSIDNVNDITRLTQTAYYYPRGLVGILYWYSIYPIHIMVFRGMAKAIKRKAESIE